MSEVQANPAIEKPVTLEKFNPIADLLFKTGAAIGVVGVIAGIIIISVLKVDSSYTAYPHPLRWVYGIAVIVTSLISCFLFIGFAEQIRLLHEIRRNTGTNTR